MQELYSNSKFTLEKTGERATKCNIFGNKTCNIPEWCNILGKREIINLLETRSKGDGSNEALSHLSYVERLPLTLVMTLVLALVLVPALALTLP